MRPLAGFIVGVRGKSYTIKLSTGNKVTYECNKKFTYGDEVEVAYNFKLKRIVGICKLGELDEPEVCQSCSHHAIVLGDDDIEDIFR